MRVLFVVSEDWFFVSHRLALAERLIAAGYQVGVATKIGRHAETIRARGVKLIPINFDRASRNPIRELGTVVELIRAYRAYRPDIVHHVAMKPVVYGTLAAKFTGVSRIVNALSGLGYVFTSTGWRPTVARQLVKLAYRLLLSGGRTIVQNPDDHGYLLRKRMVRADRISLILGAGADLKVFRATDELPVSETRPPLVVLPARMLRDKGVAEFVAAARVLKARGVVARFALVGTPDPANPATFDQAQLDVWAREGDVEYWGWRDDMVAVYRDAHIVCLPSYREGLPKTLIEAAASQRAVVTTDVPGCRDAVIADETALLVRSRESQGLTEALARLLSDGDLRRSMGRRGRQLAVEKFSLDRVTTDTIAIYRKFDEARPQARASSSAHR